MDFQSSQPLAWTVYVVCFLSHLLDDVIHTHFYHRCLLLSELYSPTPRVVFNILTLLTCPQSTRIFNFACLFGRCLLFIGISFPRYSFLFPILFISSNVCSAIWCLSTYRQIFSIFRICPLRPCPCPLLSPRENPHP